MLSSWKGRVAIIKRFYDHALKLGKTDEFVWISMGISACEIADNLTNEKSKKAIYKEGEHAILYAMTLRLNSSYTHYILGYLYYFQGQKQAALDGIGKCGLSRRTRPRRRCSTR